jgi:tetratricopeptide (TPR) repeat protein
MSGAARHPGRSWLAGYARRVPCWGPLLALFPMLSLRWRAMVAPSEEPKWAVMVLLGLALGWAFAARWRLACRTEAAAAQSGTGCGAAGLGSAIFLLGLALGVAYSVNPWEGWNRGFFWASAALVFWASATAARADTDYQKHLRCALAGAGLLFSGLFWRMYWVDYAVPGHAVQREFSPAGHVNFTADALVMLIPLLAWAVLSAGHWAVRAAALAALASCAVMLLTGASRGGVGGLALGGLLAVGILLARGLRFRSALPGKRAVAALLGVTLATAAIYALLPYKFREVSRFGASLAGQARGDNPLEHGLIAQILDSTQHLEPPLPPLAPVWAAAAPWLGIRVPVWASTCGMVAAAPWLGHGTGAYLFAYPEYGNRYPSFRNPLSLEKNVTTNPHNVLLQIAADNGIPMALLFAGLYAALLGRLVRQAWREPRAWWLCGAWAAAAVAFDAQFNHVFFNPASLFLCALGLGALHGALPAPTPGWRLPLCRFWRGRPALGLAAALWLAAAAIPLGWLVSERQVAAAQALEAEGKPGVAERYQAALAWSPGNFRALYGAAVSEFKAGRLAQAESRVRRFLEIYPHHLNGLNLLGAVLLETNRPQEAEAAFAAALRVYPDSPLVRQNLGRAIRQQFRSFPERGGQ